MSEYCYFLELNSSAHQTEYKLKLDLGLNPISAAYLCVQ